MTGPRRKRRGSMSSVETVDQNQIQWLQETSVVRSVPKYVDPNDWPIFELRDAVVLNKDGETLENALHVGTRGPFILRGNLIIDDPAQKSHLIKKVRSSTPIEIRQSNLYSLDLPDGQAVIWVSGKGGWYEVKPSPSYQQIYNKMCEAVTLYFNLVDIYTARVGKKSKSKGSGAKSELSQIFFNYAARIGDGSTLNDVTERCLDHALFLLWHFTQERPDYFSWESTAFYKFLEERKPELFAKVADLSKNPRKLAPSPPSEPRRATPAVTALPSRSRAKSSVSSAKDSDLEVIDTKDFMPRQRSSRSRSTALVDLTTEAENKLPVTVGSKQSVPSKAGQPLDAQGADPAFQTVLAAMEWVHKELDGKPKGLNISTTLNRIYFDHKFPSYKDGTVGCHKKPVEEVLHYNAKNLLRHLDKAKFEKHEIWGWLQRMAQTKFSPVAFKPSDLPFPIVPRTRMSRKAQADQMQIPDVDSSQVEEDKAMSTHVPPRVGKRPGRRPGKKSSLRPASGSTKRPHAELEGDSDTEMSVAKKSHYFSGDEEDVEESMSSRDAADGDSQMSEEELIKLVIRAEKIPSNIPHGHDGTWSCEQEDCDYVVRGSDEQECQNRIREHFHEHEEQATRVNLAVAESRGQLPINHLLDKIKKLGENAQQVSVNGVVLPQPIKRKLIV